MDKAYKIVWRGCGDYTDRAYFESFLQSVTQGGRVLEELNLPICEPATHPYFPLDALRSACGGFQEAAALARRYGMRVGINQTPAGLPHLARISRLYAGEVQDICRGRPGFHLD